MYVFIGNELRFGDVKVTNISTFANGDEEIGLVDVNRDHPHLCTSLLSKEDHQAQLIKSRVFLIINIRVNTYKLSSDAPDLAIATSLNEDGSYDPQAKKVTFRANGIWNLKNFKVIRSRIVQHVYSHNGRGNEKLEIIVK